MKKVFYPIGICSLVGLSYFLPFILMVLGGWGVYRYARKRLTVKL